MGLLVDGQWREDWYENDDDGRFVRPDTVFRGKTVQADGPHPPEAGRYRLYVSYACPWAHRTLIVRKLKGLEDTISLSVVSPLMGDEGWTFADFPGVQPDPRGAKFLREIYLRAKSDYTGRVTVPILYDEKADTIVNNESSELIRILGAGFNALCPDEQTRNLDLYPEALRREIDEINDFVYDNINNGVYKAGFATSQKAYDEAVESLFAALDKIEDRLKKNADQQKAFLVSAAPTEADWRLFTTLYRFDAVYQYHFKCNIKRIADYAHLSAYLKKLYAVPGVAETCQMNHCKDHYFRSHPQINPTGIVPKGPALDL